MHATARTCSALVMSLFVTAFPACTGWGLPGVSPRADPVPVSGRGQALDLAALAVIDLPSDVRDGRPPPASMPLLNWTPVPGASTPTFQTVAPIRPRASFFKRAPRGTRLLDRAGKSLPYASDGLRRWWRLDDGHIQVQLPAGEADLDGLVLQSAIASGRERRLNPSFAGLPNPEAFSRARLQIGDTTREGLLLPAPASAAIDLNLPPAAELHMRPLLVPPELADLPPGDGAIVVVSVEVGTERTEVYRAQVNSAEAPEVHIDLSRWAGQDVRLHLQTEPGASTRYDYVLLADPIVASRVQTPRRAVVVFVDTLRADHLPAYGSTRDTAPWITSQGAQGAVFERAHTIAPWTLPSYRALWTGRRPTRFGSGATLGTALREHGFATAMIGANLYLSNTFSGARGFGMHRVEHLAPAEDQVEHALSWLADHQDRDAVLVLHLMDPHLPYREPEPFRSRFAGPPPDDWKHGDDFLRPVVGRARPELRAWIEGRYDNNIAYVDAQLARLGAALGPADHLVILSDHGEEFWDHGGFEHGHSLHEELVHIPLIVKGPDIEVARHAQAVSLLDVAPTLAGLLDVPLPGVDGRDLGPLLAGPSESPDPPGIPMEHAIPLGHPLYGFERWGVTTGTETYESHGGHEHRYVLADEEQVEDELAEQARAEWRARLAAAHEHDVVETLRIAVRSRGARGLSDTLTIEVQGADPKLAAWLGEDATASQRASITREGDRIEFSLPRRWRGSRELHLLGPTAGLALTVSRGPLRLGPIPVPEATYPDGTTYLEQPVGEHATLQVTRAITLRPKPEDSPTSGYDPELRAMLERAGYLTRP